MLLLRRVVSIRDGETTTTWLMFAYSFLAMAAYNIVKPITRASFIDTLGADDLPWVQLGGGIAVAVTMQAYSGVMSRLPRRWLLPATQAAIIALVLVFWLLLQSRAAWVSVALYVFWLMAGLLLISQFWTLANDIYDSRQARRLFGFIGGGASLGGAAGFAVTLAGASSDDHLYHLLPVSAAVLLACLIVTAVIVRRQPAAAETPLPERPPRAGTREALRLVRRSAHLKVITLLIAFAAVAAVFIEQQLNMAAAENAATPSAIAAFLATVGVWVSLAGFVVQVVLVRRVLHSLLIALLLLPVSMGATAGLILGSAAFGLAVLSWTPGVARVLDTSIRYTIDRTTREVLFMPVSSDVKYFVKPFLDVSVDRFARAIGAVALLVLIKPWGLHLDWPQISYASLVVTAVWIGLAIAARREYIRAFRRSLTLHEFEPTNVRFDVAEGSTIDALVDELSKPDEASVLYALDMLDTLGKRDRIPPLLLRHQSAAVRARALEVLSSGDAPGSDGAIPSAHEMLSDPAVDVRAAAVRAIVRDARDRNQASTRRFLEDDEPRVAVAAAIELADSSCDENRQAAERTLARLAEAPGPEAAAGRRAVAAGLSQVANPDFRELLIPLIHDSDLEVAREAISSARAIGASDALFVPALVSLLGHRQLKGVARAALVSYGEVVVDMLAHFLLDRHESLWVRRHLPATLARIPCQRTVDILIDALDEPDGFLRYKLITAIEALQRTHPRLSYPPARIEARILGETGRYYTYLTLRHNLTPLDRARAPSLLVQALGDKLDRTLDRIYRLLGLIHPWQEIAATRYAIEHGTARSRAGGLEYLDNVLASHLRRRVIPILDTAPLAEKVWHANSVLRSRPRDVPDTVAQLLHDDDPVVGASAVHFTVTQGLREPLGDDLSYLAARASHPLVREAAGWALTAGPADGGQKGFPVVELADRLRAIPLFAFVSVDELFRAAGTAERVHAGPGELYRRGAAAAEVFFLLEGRVQIGGAAAAPAPVHAPAALNLTEVLEDRPLPHALDAIEPVVGLVMPANAFMTMLGDNVATAQGLCRMLLAAPGSLDWLGATPDGPLEEKGEGEPTAMTDPVEVARRLRQIPLFSGASVDHLQDLVAVTREAVLEPGDVLWGDGREPSVYHVLRGKVTLQTDDRPVLAVGPGRTLGVAETLTGGPLGRRAVVTEPGVAYRIDHDDLYEVLGDHGDLLQGVFRTVLAGPAGERGVR